MKFRLLDNLLTTIAAAVLLVGMAERASASPITAVKASADFNLNASVNLEGVDPLDTPNDNTPYGSNFNDWTPNYSGSGEYQVAQDGIDSMVGTSGAFDATTGWTVEFRMKVDAATLPTESQKYAMSAIFSDGVAGNYYVLNVGDNGNFTVRKGNDAPFFTGSPDNYYTVRVAKEANADHAHVFVDGAEVTTITGASFALNRQWFGDVGGGIAAGPISYVDYIRFDSTGGYAPIPEPSSLLLTGLGLVGAICSRRRR